MMILRHRLKEIWVWLQFPSCLHKKKDQFDWFKSVEDHTAIHGSVFFFNYELPSRKRDSLLIIQLELVLDRKVFFVVKNYKNHGSIEFGLRESAVCK